MIGESGWEVNYLDFQKASDKFAKLLRKLLRQELWEERPNSVQCFQLYWEEKASKEAYAAAMAWPKDAFHRLGL